MRLTDGTRKRFNEVPRSIVSENLKTNNGLSEEKGDGSKVALTSRQREREVRRRRG